MNTILLAKEIISSLSHKALLFSVQILHRDFVQADGDSMGIY